MEITSLTDFFLQVNNNLILMGSEKIKQLKDKEFGAEQPQLLSYMDKILLFFLLC